MSSIDMPELDPVLRFNPKKWWDPVPFWLFEHLELEHRIQLSKILLKFEANVLNAQLEANQEAQQLLGRIG